MKKEIIEKIHEFIIENSGGVSIPQSEQIKVLLKEKAEYSRGLFMDSIQFLGAIMREKGSLEEFLQRPSGWSYKELVEFEEQSFDESTDAEPILCFMDLCLSSDYNPPLSDLGEMQRHLGWMLCCYAYILPNLDKVYPQVNMRLDEAFAKLAFAMGIFEGTVFRVEAWKDHVRPAVERKKEKANKRTAIISHLLMQIALEEDRERRSHLIADAMKAAKLSSSRSILNRVAKIRERLSSSD